MEWTKQQEMQMRFVFEGYFFLFFFGKGQSTKSVYRFERQSHFFLVRKKTLQHLLRHVWSAVQHGPSRVQRVIDTHASQVL